MAVENRPDVDDCAGDVCELTEEDRSGDEAVSFDAVRVRSSDPTAR